MDETENKNIAKIYFIMFILALLRQVSEFKKIKFIVCDELNWHSDKN